MAGPIDVVYVDGVAVAKGDVRSFGKVRSLLVMADATEVANADLSLQLLIILKSNGRIYKLNTLDTTTASDGTTFLRDVNGLGFELVVVEGLDGRNGATVLVQDAEPVTDYVAGSIWIDADSTDLDLYTLTGSPLAWVDSGVNLKGTNGVDGTNGIDGASALTVVRVVDLSGADPATAYENGDTLDGKVLATNDLILRAKPVADAANGVYVVPASGAASRASAFAAYDDHCGRFFGVKDGTSKGKLFGCTSAPGGTLGTTAIVISEFTSGGAVGRNRIINPSGTIAQAGLASTADGTYTGFDQWLALTQSNPVTPSALTNVEDGTPYMMRITQANASAQRFGLIQWIETANCIDLRGQSVFLTARVRMSASTTLRYAIVEWTGTADTITKDIVNSWTNTTFTAGQFFTSTSTTIVATGSTALTANTLASISLSGTVSSSQNNLAVFFWTDSTQAQNVTLDVGKVDLKRSTVTSAHEARSYQEELLLCLRFYYSIGGLNAGERIANGFVFSATVFACFVEMKVRMLKDPTVSVSAAGDFGLIIGGSLATPSAIASASACPTSVGFDATITGGTAGQGGLLRAANTNARLKFAAQL